MVKNVLSARYVPFKKGREVRKMPNVDASAIKEEIRRENAHVVNVWRRRIDDACRSRILARYSLERQSNMNRELALLLAETPRTDAQDARLDELKSAFAWIDAMRARHAEIIEEAIPAAAKLLEDQSGRVCDIVDPQAGSVFGRGAWPE